MTTLEERVQAAFDQLAELGFDLPTEAEFDFEGAAERFSSGTLHKVFALSDC